MIYETDPAVSGELRQEARVANCAECHEPLPAGRDCNCVEPEPAEPEPDRCTNPGGHEFVCTGTAYGGDDERFLGEGRSYCVHCGQDGDS